jgi:hypothetical protein
MAELDVLKVRGVIERLVAPSERWGWEFHEPVAVRPYPQARPRWSEPREPYLPTHTESYARARAALPKRAAIAGAILLVGLCAGRYGLLLDLVALGLAAFWFVPMVIARQKASELLAAHAQHRQAAWHAFGATDAQWQHDEQRWTHGEHARVAAANRWFPITPHTAPARIDVYGGTAEGHARFLVTLGSGLLGGRVKLTVLDLTERDVADPVSAFTRLAEFPYRHVRLPADLHQAGLLDGMDAEDVAELIAEALHTRRNAHESGALRDLDADILKNVARRLDGTITFARLVAALRVVQRIDQGGRDPLLSAQERLKLTEYVDVLGSSERNTAQAQDLRSTLEALIANDTTPAGYETGTAGTDGLTVYVSEDPNNRRRELLNRLVVETMIHRLRRREITGEVLAVAGADHLGAPQLQRLHRATQRAGVRLVLLIEHLSDEYESFLGDADSTSIFMRMQNTKEAARAAEYIGRGHTFTLTQLSHTAGTSTSNSTNTSHSTSQSRTDTTGSSGGGGTGGGWNKSESHTMGVSETHGFSDTTGTNESNGRTESRVYEFTVEPTTFQGLDPAGFILVEPVPGGTRRVLAGTCDPAVLTLPGVADQPLNDTERQSPVAEAAAAAAALPRQQQAEPPLTEVNIADPTGQYRQFAETLTRAGYILSYETHPIDPAMNGWLITGHRDGRPLNPAEIMSHR